MEDNNLESRIIVALDFPTFYETKKFVDEVGSDLRFVKLGLELFCGEGPKMISYLKEKDLKVFLDLKLHDIPNTVKGAVKRILNYGVDFLTVHAAGGPQMLSYAKEAVMEGKEEQRKLKLLAVTILTSLDREILNNDLQMPGDLNHRFTNLSLMSYKNGMDGIICSPNDLSSIKNEVNESFLKVTPGIRIKGSLTQDQKRVATPQFAFENGATHIVVGREITKSLDPRKSLAEIIDNGKRSCIKPT